MNTIINKNDNLEPSKFPDRITLELTNRCNLNCIFCPRRLMESHQGLLDTTLAKRLIDEMAQNLPVSLVPFFRGEPLLHPDWIEILGYAKQKGIGPIQFTTNGMLLKKEMAEAILDLRIDFISFSMDTLDSDLYQRTRRGADYNIVLNNVLRFVELKKKKGFKLPLIQVSAINTPLHEPGIQSFVSFWRKKVDKVRVYVEHSQDGHPGSISAPLPLFDFRLPCRKVFEDMVIYWDGEVALCNHDWIKKNQQRIGNIRDEDIASVWQSLQYQVIREKHKNGNLENMEPCSFCDHWKMYYLPGGLLGSVYSGDSSEL